MTHGTCIASPGPRGGFVAVLSLVAALAAAMPAPLRASEADQPPGPSAARRAFAAVDTNGDGAIDLAEYQRNVLASWRALDREGSGLVEIERLFEMPDRRQARRVVAMLRRADADGDGRLDFREVVRARMATFDAADLDGDERLSLSETLAYRRAARR